MTDPEPTDDPTTRPEPSPAEQQDEFERFLARSGQVPWSLRHNPTH